MKTKEAAFLRFIHERKSDFSRIAFKTQGEYSSDDLTQEVWLIAGLIEKKLGRPVDFDDFDDRNQVMAWTFNKFVKFSDKSMRSAVKLDMYWDEEPSDSMSYVFEGVLKDEGADPLKQLQAAEEVDEFWSGILQSYSQLTAYIILLDRFGGAQKDLAEYLGLLANTLQERVNRARAHACRQSSLFDGVEQIELDFLPFISRKLMTPIFTHIIADQCELSF